MLGWGLGGCLESADFAFIAPEAVVAGVLLLDEGIVGDVGGEEGLGLGRVAVLRDLPESASEFVFAVLARNVSAISRHLSPRVIHVHGLFYL